MFENFSVPFFLFFLGGWGPSSLDHSRSFTVSYEVGKSVDLAYHYDDSEAWGNNTSTCITVCNTAT